MAETSLNTDLAVQKWDAQFFAEYVRNSGFLPYMSRGSESIIVTKRELVSSGQTVNVPLIPRLKGAGVTGNDLLEGNEEGLQQYNFPVSIETKRNGIVLKEQDEHFTEIDMRRAARDGLRTWAEELMRDEIIDALGSIGGVNYASATEAQKDAWLDNNLDRVLFGTAKSNVAQTSPAGGATNDHSASLAAIASTQKLSASVVSLMKRIAKTADPHIRPHRVRNESGREYYVMFAGSNAFRDLKEDSTIAQANREARPRDVSQNPIFQDGDLIYDGVVIREIPEIAAIGNVGASSATVAPVYLCGAQAIAYAIGREPQSRTRRFDYNHRFGVGITMLHGIKKMQFNSKDHGMVTGYVAAAADA